MTVALVGCCAAKLAYPAPAQDLYVSPLFRKARAWAELYADAWAILSALRGVVPPDRVIGPYDARLPKGESYQLWQLAAHVQLHELFPGAEKFIFLAGADYACDVIPHCPVTGGEECRLPFSFPMLGMGVGERLHFLDRRIS
jgi:hypothetical protein